MAKSEIPNIVVHGGGGSGGTVSDAPSNGGAPASLCPSPPLAVTPAPKVGQSRLAKQEEVDLEESVESAPLAAPITICIGCEEEEETEEGLKRAGPPGSPPASVSPPPVPPHAPAGRGASQRLRLLVRSQAVRDDTSPPLDPSEGAGGPRMLSVQGQTKGTSGKHGGRIGKQGTGGSQGSLEGSSPSLSRDSSTETYTDSTGVDLEQFIVETLHKNHKDRVMMLKIEQDLINLIRDSKRQSYKFGQMSSYHRMLVHRVAAYFGLDHNVDPNGTSVIVNKTRNTRLPDARFKDQIRDDLLQEEPKRSILKRNSTSFEDGKEKSPERQSSTDSRRSKSIEEREEEYEKARARIFNQDECMGGSPLSRSSQEDLRWSSDPRPWSSTDSGSSGSRGPLVTGLDPETGDPSKGGIKVYSLLTKGGDPAEGPRLGKTSLGPGVTKASSFGGVSVLHRDSSLNEARTAAFRTAKADSFNVSSLPTVVQGTASSSAAGAASPREATPLVEATPTTPGTPATTPASLEPHQCYAVGAAGQVTWMPSNGRDPAIGRAEGSGTPVQQHQPLHQQQQVQQQQAQPYTHPGGTTFWSLPPPSVDPSVPPPGSILLNPQTGAPLLPSEALGGPYRVRVGGSPLSAHPPALMLSPLPQGGYVTAAAPHRVPQAPSPALVYVPYLPPSQLQQHHHNEGIVREANVDCGGVLAEVGSHLGSLSLVPSSESHRQHPQPQHSLQQQQPVGMCPVPAMIPGAPVEVGTPSGGYLVHAAPLRGYVAPQQPQTSIQGPVYYVQQAVPTSCGMPSGPALRGYLCSGPAHATTAPPPPQVAAHVTDLQAFVPQGAAPPQAVAAPGGLSNPVASPLLAGGYRVLGYYQQQPPSAGSHQVAHPQQCAVSEAATSPVYATYAVASSPPEAGPFYPGGVLVGNAASGTQVVPMYLLATGASTPTGPAPAGILASPHSQAPGGAAQTTPTATQTAPPQFSFRYLPVRPPTPPTQLGAGAAPPAPSLPQHGAQPLLGYTLYSAGPLQAHAGGGLVQGSTSLAAPPVGSAHPQFAPVMTTFQVLRPSLSLMGTGEGSSPPHGVPGPPPTALVLSSQFSTPPPPLGTPAPPAQAARAGPQVLKPCPPGVQAPPPFSQANQAQQRPAMFTLGEPPPHRPGGVAETFAGGASSEEPQQQRQTRTTSLGQASRNGTRQQPVPVAAPTLPAAAVYRRAAGIPLLPDVRLLGHPLQQQLRQLVPGCVRPRFPLLGAPGGLAAPPPSQCPGGRPPKTGGRKQRGTRTTRPAPAGAGDAPLHQQQSSSASQQPSANSGPHVPEVEGLSEGPKLHEAERFQEHPAATSARPQFVGSLPGPRGRGMRVLAPFDPPSVARGAPDVCPRPLPPPPAAPRPPS